MARKRRQEHGIGQMTDRERLSLSEAASVLRDERAQHCLRMMRALPVTAPMLKWQCKFRFRPRTLYGVLQRLKWTGLAYPIKNTLPFRGGFAHVWRAT